MACDFGVCLLILVATVLAESKAWEFAVDSRALPGAKHLGKRGQSQSPPYLTYPRRLILRNFFIVLPLWCKSLVACQRKGNV